MKSILYLFLPIMLSIVLFGCTNSDYGKIKTERDVLAKRVVQDSILISTLRDSIELLSFPANQRLEKINNLISLGSYQEAKKEIANLNELFPESKEAKATPNLMKRIEQLIEKKRSEEERIKALGFKAIPAKQTVKVDYNTIEFSSISVGNTFTFDSYGDRYFYRTADRGNKYITAAMKITSDSNTPKLPQLAVYAIQGDHMEFIDSFTTRFARWKDYGTYLGNYHDFGNDFAKTSSVRFKIGAEVTEELTKKAFALVLKKENALTRYEERFDDPPVQYRGSVDYPQRLVLDNFTGENSQYYIIKTFNL